MVVGAGGKTTFVAIIFIFAGRHFAICFVLCLEGTAHNRPSPNKDPWLTNGVSGPPSRYEDFAVGIKLFALDRR